MSSTRTRGKKGRPHREASDPARRRANKRRGHGTYETDRPPIFGVVGRHSGQMRYFVREHSDASTCLSVVCSTVPTPLTEASPLTEARPLTETRPPILYTDEWNGYGRVRSVGIGHSTVHHGRDATGRREWARDDDGDGIREVHCNTCEGAGTALRTFLRMFRGVHKFYLAEYVAVFETMYNAKRITPEVIRRMCYVPKHVHSRYT